MVISTVPSLRAHMTCQDTSYPNCMPILSKSPNPLGVPRARTASFAVLNAG